VVSCLGLLSGDVVLDVEEEEEERLARLSAA
jgi:hypothetical protein